MENTVKTEDGRTLKDPSGAGEWMDWDIDANLPMYTRDYVRLDHPAVHWDKIDHVQIVLSSGEKFNYPREQVNVVLKSEDNLDEGVKLTYQGVGGDSQFNGNATEEYRGTPGRNVFADATDYEEESEEVSWALTPKERIDVGNITTNFLVGYGLIPDAEGMIHPPTPESEDAKEATDVKRDSFGRIIHPNGSDIVGFMQSQLPGLLADELDSRRVARIKESIDRSIAHFASYNYGKPSPLKIDPPKYDHYPAERTWRWFGWFRRG